MSDDFDYYLDLNQKLHKRIDYGRGHTNLDPTEARFILSGRDIITVLDYGCGKGGMVERLGQHFTVIGYDPAVPKYSFKPHGIFDAVICADVLEHIPKSLIFQTLSDIESYVHKFFIFTVCTKPSNAIMENGKNAHVTLESLDWWQSTISSILLGFDIIIQPKGTQSQLFILGWRK
jgi:hypothetical protein